MELYLCINKDFSGISDRCLFDSWQTVIHTIKRQITGCLALFDINAQKNWGLGEGEEIGCGMDSRTNIIMICQFVLYLLVIHFVGHRHTRKLSTINLQQIIGCLALFIASYSADKQIKRLEVNRQPKKLAVCILDFDLFDCTLCKHCLVLVR